MPTDDIKPSELIMNTMSEAQLKQLKDSGTVPPNQLFFTNDSSARLSDLPIGMILSSAVVQNDAGLHLLDGSSLLDDGIYSQFCNWIKARKAENSANVPTCTEAEYTTEMNTYGQCGKFVIGTDYVKLPTITKFIEGLSNIADIGKSLAAGLPNITGLAQVDRYVGAVVSGAFSYSNIFENVSYSSGTQHGGATLNLDASKSNPIYGKSNTVQPQATKYPYYIVVATTAKTDIQVDIDNISNDLARLDSSLTTAKTDIQSKAMEFVAHYKFGTAEKYICELTNRDDFKDYIWKIYFCVYGSIGDGGDYYIAFYKSDNTNACSQYNFTHLMTGNPTSLGTISSDIYRASGNELINIKKGGDWTGEMTFQLNDNEQWVLATLIGGRVVNGQAGFSKVEANFGTNSIRKFAIGSSSDLRGGRFSIYKIRRK